MAPENKSKTNNSTNKKRKQYRPNNKPVRKGAYPLRPGVGVEGFFITCDGGRESQASREAIDVIDSFYEELVEGSESKVENAELPQKPLNKVTKFTYSDSSSSNEDEEDEEDEEEITSNDQPENNDNSPAGVKKNNGVATREGCASDEPGREIRNGVEENKENPEGGCGQDADSDAGEPPLKKPCVEPDPTKKIEVKSIDKLIEAELAQLRDRTKRRLTRLDSGCNGVLFLQLRKREGDPGPKDIVQRMMTSLASTKKHVSRFLLRVLPVEVSCYPSEDEIKRAIKPLIDKYFPVESEAPLKFAVLYDARANTGIDRIKVIDAVAKCVPSVHKVDLGKPDLHIVVQIVKTVCLIGVVEKYKELAKYNIRQLTSQEQ